MASRYAVGDKVRIADRDTLLVCSNVVSDMLSMANKVATIGGVNVSGFKDCYSIVGSPYIWKGEVLLPYDLGIKDMGSLLNFIGE